MNPSCIWPLAAAALVAPATTLDVARLERPRVVAAAARFLEEDPRTVTAARSPRSAGGPHDFFSEGDYWWPDPKSPDGPYVQRDGMTNPDNFVEHRRALMRLSVQVPALAAAWRLTGDGRYAVHAGRHLRAWFVDPETRMAPHLRYAQAIHGITTGRAQGVIDTLHLVEVARAIEVLDQSPALSLAEQEGVRGWFREYLAWLTTDENALKERDARNNHATCWLLQVAAFARLVGDEKELAAARERFKTVIVPGQVAADGSFPEELRRTKPYGYSLFNLEAMAGVAQTLATKEDDLWAFALPDGRGLRSAMAYMVPYIRDKKTWPKPPDVMYDAEWPMRQASLLFGGLALGQPDYIALWKTLPADSNVEEVVRNYFIRQPVLWLEPTAERGGARSAARR
jgi:alginate lyase